MPDKRVELTQDLRNDLTAYLNTVLKQFTKEPGTIARAMDTQTMARVEGGEEAKEHLKGYMKALQQKVALQVVNNPNLAPPLTQAKAGDLATFFNHLVSDFKQALQDPKVWEGTAFTSPTEQQQLINNITEAFAFNVLYSTRGQVFGSDQEHYAICDYLTQIRSPVIANMNKPDTAIVEAITKELSETDPRSSLAACLDKIKEETAKLQKGVTTKDNITVLYNETFGVNSIPGTLATSKQYAALGEFSKELVKEELTKLRTAITESTLSKSDKKSLVKELEKGALKLGLELPKQAKEAKNTTKAILAAIGITKKEDITFIDAQGKMVEQQTDMSNRPRSIGGHAPPKPVEIIPEEPAARARSGAVSSGPGVSTPPPDDKPTFRPKK